MVTGGGVEGVDGAGAGVGADGAMAAGTHPPFTHAPPPIVTNGSGVVHPVVLGAGAGGVGVDGCGAEGAMPAGTQPPPRHTPPPMATNGSGVVQPPVLGAGAGAGVDGAGGGGAGADGCGAEGAMPAGIQPPLTHTPPPMATKGSGVVHPPVLGAGAGDGDGDGDGAGVLVGGAMPGGNHAPL